MKMNLAIDATSVKRISGIKAVDCSEKRLPEAHRKALEKSSLGQDPMTGRIYDRSFARWRICADDTELLTGMWPQADSVAMRAAVGCGMGVATMCVRHRRAARHRCDNEGFGTGAPVSQAVP
eukprot:CAMPEP_0115828960 /NCGR_PEP_ID=MMETSP0287-20121206/849_1 /TAXON_ID=412157 /ORGANISM="Chrysochromulina rotalis, Strain UIO044" /LENGTH=121 /DNA_ID=CAMNT_0003282205 /DNA_START=247 /DNA_END=610 /DNA_ORIENTATION=-